jgi:hypothetical protein
MHRSKRANGYAGAATDTFVVVHLDPPHAFIPFQGFGRAPQNAGGVFALLAGYRYVNAFGLPFYDSDPAAGRIGNAIVPYGANQFAQPASGAFFVIDFKNFAVFLHARSPGVSSG